MGHWLGRKCAKKTLLSCGLLLLASTGAVAGETQVKHGRVEIERDRWGVPHVFADTDGAAMYGLGYATAQDRAFQMHYTLRVIQGRLAEVLGDVPHTRRRETAVDSDRKMRTFGFAPAARRRVEELDAETRALLDAYADGVNAYFAEHRDHLPELFDKTGLVPERWTAADCLLSWWHVAQFFATDGTRDLLRYRNLGQDRSQLARAAAGARGRGATRGQGPALSPQDLQPVGPDDTTAVVGRADVTDAWLEKTRTFLRTYGYVTEPPTAGSPIEAPKFSHAWVGDGRFTGTGGAVLVSMPQTMVANPSLFYEFHICGATLDARGIGVAGSPILLIGWNRNVAWGLTALGADQADLFRLKTDDDHPDQYSVDGQWRPIETRREEIKIAGAPGQILRVRETCFGPIVNEFAFAQPGDPLVALKRIPVCDTGCDTVRGGLRMMRAANVRQFMSALEHWRFPTANVVVGDRAGSIAFATIGALPLRAPNSPEQGGAALDGSASANDWQTIIPQDLVPQVVNPPQGYLFSGNHRPVGSFYPIPLGISTGSMGDSLRSWRLRQLFSGAQSLTDQQLLDMVHDSTNPARQAIVRLGFHLRDREHVELSAECGLAMEHLKFWFESGASSRLDVPGAELAVLINTQFRFVNSDLAFVYGGGESGLSQWLSKATRRIADNPSAELSPLEQEYVQRLLSDAWTAAVRQWGADPTSWNAQAREDVTRQRIGYYESLDGFPSLDQQQDLPMPALLCTDRATIFSQAGQAYVQWVPLTRVDEARSLLPPGQCESPASVLRTVNMESWRQGELHPAPLSRTALEPYIIGRLKLETDSGN